MARDRRTRNRGYRRPHGGSPRKKKPYKKKQFIKREREVIILDLLPHGHVGDKKPSWARKPLSQVLTFSDFVLYEVEFNRESDIKVQEKDTYENFRNKNKLGKVIRKIDYNDLTNTSKALIQPILEKEINNYEELFINFFNKSTSITPRLHALKLIPGIGQKHMWEILEARNRQEFVTFQDISDRTSISNPPKQIALRIIKELKRDVKYYLFSKTKRYE
jgi:putative nucleotide binding protein